MVPDRFHPRHTRVTALAAGALYVLTFVSIPTLARYGPVRDRNYVTGPGPDTAVTVGGLLEVLVALAALPIALWEFSLGIWLIVKGFRPSPRTSADRVDAPAA